MSEKDSGSRSPASINTLIGPGMRVEGNVRCNGVLRVQGAVVGDVACSAGPDSALVVDAAGSVAGNVSAIHVAVKGSIAGPLHSSGAIEVHQGGTVTGDISFRELAIHAGGVVEGLLKPLPAEEGVVVAESPRPAERSGKAGAGTRGAAIAAVLLAVLAAAAWKGRDMLSAGPVPDQAPRAEAASVRAAVEPAAPAEIGPGKEGFAHPLTQGIQGAAPPAPAAAPAATEAGVEISTVRGANPSRPPNVFLLIANEPAVFYRKKRNEPGEGARVIVSAGEKASVSISPDELIRVDKGSDVTIFYQGQKVPRQFIAGGSWIAFVAR